MAIEICGGGYGYDATGKQGGMRMSTRAGRPRTILIALAIATAALASAAPAANADFGIANWEAGTCAMADTPPAYCTYESPDPSFFTQAAGHPVNGNTDFEVNNCGPLGPGRDPEPGPGRPARGPQRQPAGGAPVPESGVRRKPGQLRRQRRRDELCHGLLGHHPGAALHRLQPRARSRHAGAVRLQRQPPRGGRPRQRVSGRRHRLGARLSRGVHDRNVPSSRR